MSDVKFHVDSLSFIHRKVAGEDILVSVGENVANFNGYIQLNVAAAFLWDEMKSEKTISELETALAKQFDIDSESAHRDTEEFLGQLLERGMVIKN